MTLLLAMWLAAAPPGKAVLIDRIAATVEGRVIAASHVEVRAARFKETREQALTSLIERILMQRAAEGAGIIVTDQEIDAALDDIIAKNQLTRAVFLDALKKQGWELEPYRAEIGAQLRELKVLQLGGERDRQRVIEALKKSAVIEVRR